MSLQSLAEQAAQQSSHTGGDYPPSTALHGQDEFYFGAPSSAGRRALLDPPVDSGVWPPPPAMRTRSPPVVRPGMDYDDLAGSSGGRGYSGGVSWEDDHSGSDASASDHDDKEVTALRQMALRSMGKQPSRTPQSQQQAATSTGSRHSHSHSHSHGSRRDHDSGHDGGDDNGSDDDDDDDDESSALAALRAAALSSMARKQKASASAAPPSSEAPPTAAGSSDKSTAFSRGSGGRSSSKAAAPRSSRSTAYRPATAKRRRTAVATVATPTTAARSALTAMSQSVVVRVRACDVPLSPTPGRGFVQRTIPKAAGRRRKAGKAVRATSKPAKKPGKQIVSGSGSGSGSSRATASGRRAATSSTVPTRHRMVQALEALDPDIERATARSRIMASTTKQSPPAQEEVAGLVRKAQALAASMASLEAQVSDAKVRALGLAGAVGCTPALRTH